MSVTDQNCLSRRIQELASIINAPASLLPAVGTSNDFADPYILIDGMFFQYVVRERGEILQNRETRDVEKLLYWVFKGVTFNMAVEFERNHRMPGQDIRRLLFSHELQLLETLNPQWRVMEQQEIDEILLRAPYSDQLG